MPGHGHEAMIFLQAEQLDVGQRIFLGINLAGGDGAHHVADVDGEGLHPQRTKQRVIGGVRRGPDFHAGAIGGGVDLPHAIGQVHHARQPPVVHLVGAIGERGEGRDHADLTQPGGTLFLLNEVDERVRQLC